MTSGCGSGLGDDGGLVGKLFIIWLFALAVLFAALWDGGSGIKAKYDVLRAAGKPPRSRWSRSCASS